MRSKNIFQLFENSVNKNGAFFSSNWPLFPANCKVPKSVIQSLAVTLQGVEEISVNTSLDSSFEESRTELQKAIDKPTVLIETDFAYIKSNYTVT